MRFFRRVPIDAAFVAFVAFAALAALASACGPASPGPRAASAATDDPAPRVHTLEATEDEVLRDLAAIDRRLAARTRIVPRDDDVRRVALGALFADDPTLAAVDGLIDPFSFDARGRGLDAATKKAAAIPGNLPNLAEGAVSEPALERELLLRLVAEETVRLTEERALPASASELVRGVVETWTEPGTPTQAADRDRWLARRLGELRTSLGRGLDLLRARELDDALDALEHRIDQPGFGAATKELVSLRDALEAHGTRSAAASQNAWPTVSRGLAAHVGARGSAEAIGRALAVAELRLRPRAESAALSSRMTSGALASSVAAVVFATAPCNEAIVGSRIRSMQPPPERVAACTLRHAFRDARPSDATAVVAMHDHVVVARWALEVATGEHTLAEAMARHSLLSLPPPDVRAHWERLAVARPVVAIGAGLAASILGNDDVTATARAWTALGDVPFDVAVRRVGHEPSEIGDVGGGGGGGGDAGK